MDAGDGTFGHVTIRLPSDIIRDAKAREDVRERDRCRRLAQKLKAREDARERGRSRRLAQKLQMATASGPHWYQTADLMTLDTGFIPVLFEQNPIQDAAYCVNYLREVFPASLLLSQQAKKKNRRGVPADLFEKMFQLQQALFRDSRNPPELRYGLSLNVFMITTVLPRGCWDGSTGFGRGWHPRLWGSHLFPDCIQTLCWLDNILTPPESDVDAWWMEPKEYFDAASPYRELLGVYNSHVCAPHSGAWGTHPGLLGNRQYPQYDEQFDTDKFLISDPAKRFCFHQHTARLLRALYRHAHREVRERALLVASCRLPNELADLIAEHTLLAEGLQLEDDICYDPPKEGEPFQYQSVHLREPFVACNRVRVLPSLPSQRSFNTLAFDDYDNREAWRLGHDCRLQHPYRG